MAEESAVAASDQEPDTKRPKLLPKVLFVLGLPGAGKGTQCSKVIENFAEWGHISAGDCLRAERNNPESKDGELINNLIKDGLLVPSRITCKLLHKAMTSMRTEGKTCFLIDGYPRNIENDDTWKENIGDEAEVCGVLLYEGEEEALLERLLSATRGREDDKTDVIRRRFKSYKEDTMPVVERYKSKELIFSVNGMPAPEEVWEQTKAIISKVCPKAPAEEAPPKEAEKASEVKK
mmetsp:Transcript_65313/g.156132  ORF Transcript_65313/g.156132 Transcript_65313/m.156132 type:complete len:235 (+) Transcript_65313:88-792(+)|eukprot:CAMPEP_0178414918 /NCGR_PEP_ID=MMETSP0689_2-20121128/23283_1 /TAXON_ID=160604 /ORGANISM="Amphidinium massartii, Strain CS-259" /LENGTH=234 /DNA_ID=CAMNT_0020036221 /DNA_START=79 /DNA_END=783 /DNA_ORIENTATION=+